MEVNIVAEYSKSYYTFKQNKRLQDFALCHHRNTGVELNSQIIPLSAGEPSPLARDSELVSWSKLSPEVEVTSSI